AADRGERLFVEVRVRQDLLDEREGAFELAVLQRAQDRVPMREVLVERTDADARDLRDARRGGSVEPLAVEDLDRGLENGEDRLLSARLSRLFSLRMGHAVSVLFRRRHGGDALAPRRRR